MDSRLGSNILVGNERVAAQRRIVILLHFSADSAVKALWGSCSMFYPDDPCCGSATKGEDYLSVQRMAVANRYISCLIDNTVIDIEHSQHHLVTIAEKAKD